MSAAAATTTALAVQAAVQGAVDAHAAVTPAMAADGTTVAAVAAVHAGAVSGAQAVADQVIARVQKAAMAVPGLVTRIEAEAGVLRADVVADVGKARADLAAVESKWHLTPLTAGIVAAVLVIAGLVAGVFALPHLGVHF